MNMWFQILKFECKYRLRRPETYLFFALICGFSIFGVDFIFQGVELGKVKFNAPMVIAKAMGAIAGIFMILTSMIMGMPMIRDDYYNITSLIYTNPISKFDLLLGRFLGSFIILIFIFTGIPIGMMFGEFLPWHSAPDWLPFRFSTYIVNFIYILMPVLFFAASLFFFTGTLSKKLLVVYTQGIILFVLFLLTKAITNETLQAILDPFSLTTITQVTKDWSVSVKNIQLMPVKSLLLVNKIWWISLGCLISLFGYKRFSFNTENKFRKSKKTTSDVELKSEKKLEFNLTFASLQNGWNSQFKQWFSLSYFYFKSIFKETSFWAIIICGALIIIINSINLGTVYGVNSLPLTYLIIEELQELSIYFFVIILLFYSAELYWKEEGVSLNLMSDATAISSFVKLLSKITALSGIYIVLMLALILMGIVFQFLNGFFYFNLPVYFTGFFLEIFPFLILYTIVAFFFQALVNNKFLGIIMTLIFSITMIALQSLGYTHILFSFGGGALASYSEMNAYGYDLLPYLYLKFYWLLFGLLIIIFTSLIMQRGTGSTIKTRLSRIGSNISNSKKRLCGLVLSVFLSTGTFIYYQSHCLNKTWSTKESQTYRANYEKTLKKYEYLPQPKISHCNLHLELYPEQKSYELKGEYILKNIHAFPIKEVHVQKMIESDIVLDNVHFSSYFSVDSQFQKFEYMIYRLQTPLASGDSITLSFHQRYKPKGIDFTGSNSSIRKNGTFIRNNEFPTLGYFKKYELRDSSERAEYDMRPRINKSDTENINELRLSRTGSDSDGIYSKIVIGTQANQTAITSGVLTNYWNEGSRNYFEYTHNQPIINFYAILSGEFALYKTQWLNPIDSLKNNVNLEIYHHPSHNYNLNRMMNAMKASLSYYSTNFSSYQYEQLRIVEFPRYDAFAQSFPNIIPFSESIGFMLDIDDDVDIDMTFFITAHEVAHQWWGMQVEAANVIGQNFILETLAQYSALMVFKKEFSEQKVNQFLSIQKKKYEQDKLRAKKSEVPLSLVDDETYIYYHKGALIMFELQELIGEDNINQALRLFIKDWNTKNGKIKSLENRYATSEDLISYLLKVCPVNRRDEVLSLLVQPTSPRK